MIGDQEVENTETQRFLLICEGIERNLYRVKLTTATLGVEVVPANIELSICTLLIMQIQANDDFAFVPLLGS